MSEEWAPTACILCSENCGLEVQVEDGHLTKIRGDKNHPKSEGYACQKAQRLDHYVHNADRLTHPLRRTTDGSYERVSWDTAIAEIAAKLVQIRDDHSGRALAYYGGGGQGNHLGGVYGAALRAAMQSPFYYSALSQEKTGDFWVNGKLFGRQTCHVTDGIEEAEMVLFIGTNPWQAHGFPQARKVLKDLSKDPARTMVVVDPKRTKTAELADTHLQLKPGTDAFLLGALLAILVRDDLVDHDFLAARTTGYDKLATQLRQIDIVAYAGHAGVEVATLEAVAQQMASAKSVTVRADLGIQQSLNSTLNSYLEKLLFLITGNFGREGTNNFHTFLLPLIGHSKDDGVRTTVTQVAEISKLFPPNVLPAEIDTDHPGRVRALVVDSANPMRSGADTQAYGKAFDKLELLVVIDVAMTETASHAHYVLPAANQFEKWEATFFNLTFPTNAFHLRAPILEPKEGTLPELEIYRRLLVAMGEIPDRIRVLPRLARLDRKYPSARIFPAAFTAVLAAKKSWRPYAAVLLAETLGEALPNGAKSAAPLWFGAQQYAKKHADAIRRAGYSGDLGEALFNAILDGRSGVNLSTHEYGDTWKWIRHADGKIHLEISSLLDDLLSLQAPVVDPEWPFVLIAGERRSYNANTILRNPSWRRSDKEGTLSIHPDDAAEIGVSELEKVRCASSTGSVDVAVSISDALPRGVVGLPHGYGLRYADKEAGPQGVNVNELTASDHCDPLTRTPFHKTVQVRLERIA